VLLVGVFMFVFYVFTDPPMLFNPVHERTLRTGSYAGAYAALQEKYQAAVSTRRAAAAALARAEGAADSRSVAAAGEAFKKGEAEARTVRGEALTLVRTATGDATYNDVNYVFPTFILTYLPVGLVGLLIAAIFAAAMSTISAELASLSTATVIDFYRRFLRPKASDAHFLLVSRMATAVWGLFACVVAVWAAELGSLIEVVNRFGSFFYGSILGVFILAIGFRSATSNGAFLGLVAGMASVAWAASFTPVAFLWHNVIGAVAVVVVGLAISAIDPARRRARVGVPA